MNAAMITAILETRNDEVSLAHALAALVPAATEGLLRQVVVIDHGSTDGTLVVADAAGCTILDATTTGGDQRRLAAADAKGDWLLFLRPDVPLLPGWQAEAMAFIDRVTVAGNGRRRTATFCKGRMDGGWWGRLRARVSRGDGLLVAREAYLTSVSSSAPSAASRASGVHRGAA